ncbi:MAG: hypothetical protein RLZZ628_832 [Bacteroidota bacterium]
MGILLLNDVVSIEEIGDILGFNIRQDPENQQYKDEAEYDILRMALDSLEEYGMIETGFDYTACRLTRLGRKYAIKNRKFRADEPKTFQLWYDVMGENHNAVRKHFQANDPYTPIQMSSLLQDSSLRKTIAPVQIPEIWDDEKGHYFKNETLIDAKCFEIDLQITVLYDVETDELRFFAYNLMHKKSYPFCADWLLEHRQTELLESLVERSPHALPFPKPFKTALLQKKDAFEQVFQQHPHKAVEIASERYQMLDWIELPYFWNHLASFLPADAEEIWFLLPDYTDEWLAKIEKLQHSNKPIFVLLQNHRSTEKRDEFYTKTLQLSSGLYMGLTEVQDLEVLILGENCKSLIMRHLEVNVKDDILLTPVLQVQSATLQFLKEKVAPTKNYLAQHYVSRTQQAINDKIKGYEQSVKSLSKSEILAFENLDQKVQVFANVHDNISLFNLLRDIKEAKTTFIQGLQTKHSLQLSKELEKWQADFKSQTFSKLEPIQDFIVSLEKIKNELFDIYRILGQHIQVAETMIQTEITRIKEEILSKIYIIDTNIFIYEPDIISKIHIKHQIGLSHTVINELDKLKQQRDCQENASKVIKMLNQQLGENKRLKTYKADLNAMGEDYRQPSADNKILSVAYRLLDKNVVLLTNDNGLQLKAKSLEIPVISLEKLLNIEPTPVSEIRKPILDTPTKPSDKPVAKPPVYHNPKKKKR